MWSLCSPGMCVCDKMKEWARGEIRSCYRCCINSTMVLTGSLLSPSCMCVCTQRLYVSAELGTLTLSYGRLNLCFLTISVTCSRDSHVTRSCSRCGCLYAWFMQLKLFFSSLLLLLRFAGLQHIFILTTWNLYYTSQVFASNVQWSSTF